MRGRNLQLELLRRYYKIDGKRATVEMYFDTFSELVDQNVGDQNVEMLNGILQDKLEQAFSLIPRNYEIVLDIKVRDFGDYTEEEAKRIIRENMELKLYALAVENFRKRKTGLILLSGGVLILLASYFLSALNWPKIIFDVINISGTLFVWEAADIAFIERGSSAKRAKQYLTKLKGIRVSRAKPIAEGKEGAAESGSYAAPLVEELSAAPCRTDYGDSGI